MRRASIAFLLTVAILIVGAIGYFFIDEGRHSFLDCFFMSFITVATIGYGETIPLDSAAAKIFTMFLGAAGVANLAFFTSAAVAWIVELEINPLRRRRSMEKQIAKLTGHYIVCGMGRAGSRIAHELESSKAAFVCIDLDDDKLDEQALFVRGDASDEDVLASAGIEHAAGIFAVTGDDAKNLMITLAARELSPSARIVARSSDERNAKRMSKSGANATICPDIAAGAKLARAMLTPHAHGFIDELSLGGNATLQEHLVEPDHAGITLERFLSSRPGLSAMAMLRDGHWSVAPKFDMSLKQGDVLIMLSTPTKP